MFQVLTDTLVDSIVVLPILLIVYVGIEITDYKFGQIIRQKVASAGKAGPALGAITGSLPQGHFSVIATLLYNERLLTIGTLLAVYLATSDEAIPVILSNPSKAAIILPLIIIKIIIAIISGYSVDFLLKKHKNRTAAHNLAYRSGKDDKTHNHTNIAKPVKCCGQNTLNNKQIFDVKKILLHPTVHAIKIFAYILVVTVFINISVFSLGQDKLNSLFLGNSIFQPVITALFGLIPNCAVSVGIAELYLNSVITFGSVVSGLSVGGGVGMLILVRENPNKLEVFKIISLLFLISITAGLLIQFIAG